MTDLKGRVVVFSAQDGLIDPQQLAQSLSTVALEMAASVKQGMPPVGALGHACRSVSDKGHRWMAHHRKEKSSRWVRCDVNVSETALQVEGEHGVTVDSEGNLEFDSEVPKEIASQIRERYQALRGGVTGRMLGAMVEKEMRVRRRGILGNRNGGVYLVAEEHAAGLEELADVLTAHGALLSVLPWVDPQRWKGQVEQAVLTDVKAAIKTAQDAIEKAKNAKVQQRSGDTARLKMEQLEERIDTWALSAEIELASVKKTLSDLRAAIVDSYQAALERGEQ